MIETVESVALLLTIGLVPVGVLLVGLHTRMLWLLRSDHNDVWVSLGSPRLWFAKTTGETKNTMRFLWHRDYRVLGARELSMLCGAVRVLYFSFAVLFVGAAVLFLVVAFNKLGFVA